MTQAELIDLIDRGWRLTRDGSTSTAAVAWDDPDDPENGWELLVLHTEGHASRFTLNAGDSALTERSPEEARRLLGALRDAVALLEGWRGELPEVR